MPTEWLPDEPNVWGGPEPREGFRAKWLPGAFGDLTTLAGVRRFITLEDDWEVDADGNYWRIIRKARVLDD